MPAMISRLMWNHNRPDERAKRRVRGKKAADCISPSSGEPSPWK